MKCPKTASLSRRGVAFALLLNQTLLLNHGDALAKGLSPEYFKLPYQTLHCRNDQTLQLVPSNTQSLLVRRYRGHGYALNFVYQPGSAGHYVGGGLSIDIRRDGAFALRLGRLRDLCTHPGAGR